MAAPLTHTLSIILSRIVTPVWLLTGALFKLYFDMPRSLPMTVWKPAHAMGINIQHLLHVIVGVELLLVGIMVLSSRWARPLAIFILTLFSLILIGEILLENDSCGCLGKIHTPPLLILIIDGIILFGEIVCKPQPKPEQEKHPMFSWQPWPVTIIFVWAIASFGASFGVPKLLKHPTPETSENGTQTDPPVNGSEVVHDDGGCTAIVGERPPDYYIFDTEKWIGQRWEDLEIARYINGEVDDYCKGRQYVMFYNPTCDHCFEVLEMYFSNDLPVPTTVVAIPEYKRKFETEGVYDMPCVDCEKLTLKFGCDWIISPPAVVALEDGIVKCAKDSQDPEGPIQCLIWH